MSGFQMQEYVSARINGNWVHIVENGEHSPVSSTTPDPPYAVNIQYTNEGRTIQIRKANSSYYLTHDGYWVSGDPISFELVDSEWSGSGSGDYMASTSTAGVEFVTGSTGYVSGYYTGSFDDFSIFQPTAAVCFLEGTCITTDQGPIAIEQLTQNNTIFGSKVNNITESNNFFGHLIHFKPNALANNLPSTDTFLTPTHAIFCPKDKCMKMAKDLCDGENVVEDFTKDKTCKIYNVVCEDDNGDITPHSMYVNNMLCECLHPHAYPLVKNQLKW